MQKETGSKLAWMIGFVAISLAVTGYFVGLQAPMNDSERANNVADSGSLHAESKQHVDENQHSETTVDSVVPATHYSKMTDVTRARATSMRTTLTTFQSMVDPLAEIEITPQQKSFALALREQNRAFNGAPPTVPHPVDQMSTQACVACHTDGAKTATLRIPRMSHQFLTNCTQCHVERNPQHVEGTVFRENSFVGLPAPTGGPRAFPGAPPQIPHSTWMRVDCMSCHGPTGMHGIRSTHPWRQNCQQCHAPSSVLDQVQLDATPAFLPPIKLKK